MGRAGSAHGPLAKKGIDLMHHDEIIGKVQALAQLPDRGSAEQATRAVLETLAERLPSGLAKHVAAQLPPTLAAAMGSVTEPSAEGDASPSGERFDLVAFTGRIAARAATDEEGALREAAAVLEVLDAALTPELTQKITAALPRDIGQLLPSGRARDATN